MDHRSHIYADTNMNRGMLQTPTTVSATHQNKHSHIINMCSAITVDGWMDGGHSIGAGGVVASCMRMRGRVRRHLPVQTNQ